MAWRLYARISCQSFTSWTEVVHTARIDESRRQNAQSRSNTSDTRRHRFYECIGAEPECCWHSWCQSIFICTCLWQITWTYRNMGLCTQGYPWSHPKVRNYANMWQLSAKCSAYKVKRLTDWQLHLDHDIRTYRQYYRLHESTFELAKISKLVIAVDTCDPQTWKAKSLHAIDLSSYTVLDSHDPVVPGSTDDCRDLQHSGSDSASNIDPRQCLKWGGAGGCWAPTSVYSPHLNLYSPSTSKLSTLNSCNRLYRL